jgi:hypothetical protein
MVIFSIVEMVRWGKKWGKKPHRSQPIPADLNLPKTA